MGLQYLASLSHFIPELLVCLTMLSLILIESCQKESSRELLYSAGYIGLVATFATLGVNYISHTPPSFIFTKALVIDSFATLVKMMMVLATFVAAYLAKNSRDIYVDLKEEFFVMILGILVGGMLLVSANNMLIIYLGIETLSILSYALASFKKKDDRSIEAGLKYALYGGLSAGVMLFGMAHIFGVTGSIYLPEIAAQLNQLTTLETGIFFSAFLLFFVGVGYKIAVVPFHMWSPDVYEGSPLPVTTFFALVPKMAGIALLIRISHYLFASEGALSTSWGMFLGIVAALTMTIGNVAAIRQRSIKRMLAYSSIAHSGMMLLGILVINELGARAVLFYFASYLFMTAIAFFIVSQVNDRYGNDHFERFSGMIHRYPLVAVFMSLVMFSLAGLPPLAGFVAKFNLLHVIIKNNYYALGIIAGLNSVISLYYYLKIVRIMIFKPIESSEPIEGFGFVNQVLIFLLGVPIVLLGIFWSKMIIFLDNAKIFIS